jgi:uncharacterized membrane protein
MKFSLRTELPQLLIIAAMFAVAAWSWPRVPDRIPTHWNLSGEVDGYGGKFAGLLLLPLITSGTYLLLLLLPLVDPGRGNYQNFAGPFQIMRMAIVLFLAFTYGVMVLTAFGHHIDMTTVICFAAAALLMVCGNLMGKLRPNWFVGVRTPWTLSSKMSWNKTHRLAGWLLMLMGLLLAALAVFRTTWMLILMVVVDVVCLAWMVIYSYLVYRRDPNRISPAGISPEPK